jgi:uncharacterized membrane protein YwaF
VIVQKSYDAAIGRTLADLRSTLVKRGLVAAVLVALVLTVLWLFVLRSLATSGSRRAQGAEES